MGKKKTKTQTQSGVLADHKRIGKVFVPPLRQLGDFEFTNWQSAVLPELLWIAELIDRFGTARAAELSLAFARSAKQAYVSQQSVWFAATSTYTLLDTNKTDTILSRMREIGLLQDLKTGMRTLAAYYPAFPLRFLYGPDELTAQGDTELQSFKKRLASLFDRRGRIATFAQAHGVYIAFELGMLKVASNVSLANFPAIEAYPTTEESKKIAAAVRSLITGFIAQCHKSFPATWPDKFWNRGLELEGCELQ